MDFNEMNRYADILKNSASKLNQRYQTILNSLRTIRSTISSYNPVLADKISDLESRYQKVLQNSLQQYHASSDAIHQYVNVTSQNMSELASQVTAAKDTFEDSVTNM